MHNFLRYWTVKIFAFYRNITAKVTYNFCLICTLTWSKSFYLSLSINLSSLPRFYYALINFAFLLVYVTLKSSRDRFLCHPILYPVIRLQLIFSLFNVRVEIKFLRSVSKH